MLEGRVNRPSSKKARSAFTLPQPASQGKDFFMSAEEMDLRPVIAMLESKRAALDNAIAALRGILASGALGIMPDGTIPSTSVPFSASGAGGTEVPDGAFHSLSIPAAIRLYLEIVHSKKTAREISDGLKKGGLESTSKFYDKIVYATLDRLKKAGDVIKIGTAWGLPSWYPALMRAGVGDNTRKKPRRGRPPKSVAKKAEGPKLLTSATGGKKKRGALLKAEPSSSDMIDWFLRDNPGSHSSEEIKAATQISDLRAAQMLLGRMVKSGRVSKTEDGKYRKAS
jgi:hypothetical protein